MTWLADKGPNGLLFSVNLSMADAAAWTPAGDFTIEIFGVTFTVTTGQQTFFAHYNATGNQRSILFDYLSGTGLRAGASTGGTSGTTVTVTSAFTPATDGTEYNFAMDRSGSTMRLYSAGAELNSGTVSGALFGSTASPGFGHLNGSNILSGRFRAFRYTPGVARYAGAYVVPTLPLPTS